VETVLGRYRRSPDALDFFGADYERLDYSQLGVIRRIWRQITNSRVQGSAADIAKTAMNLCEASSDLRDLGVEMLLQVHDELIFEVPQESVGQADPIIKELMEHPFEHDLDVPLRISGGYGQSWAEAK
jgi:DNA polymerase I